ncbi:MAG: hypothetical protein ACYDH1_20655, partial [Anaerolineaceae bacterium]
WVKHRGTNSPSLHRSLNIPDPIHSQENWKKVEHLRDFSGHRFGKLKMDNQKDYDNKCPNSYSYQNDNSTREESDENTFPYWGED